MADFCYDKFFQHLMNGDIDLDSATIYASLLTAAYTANQSTHEDYADLAGVIASQTLSGKSITGGVFNADDVTFSAVAAGSTITQVVIWADSGSPATSYLIRKIDSYTGLPFATNGLDVNLAWPNDGNKIMKLQNG